MEYNYNALRGKIVEKCGNCINCAKQLGISSKTLSLKLNNKVSFTQNDITALIDILELDDVKTYFFTLN